MRRKTSTTISLISGAAIGAGLMCLADPGRGNRRRSFVRDKVVHGIRLLGNVIDKGIRDIRNRGRGIAAEAWCALKRDDVSDDILVDRVRAKIGRTVSHPSAIEVSTKNGRVVLSGPVLESEADDLIDAAYSVRGVRDVESRVETHRTSENVLGLQGGSGRTRPRPELLQENWAPGTRLLVGVGGAIALAFPTRNRSISLTSRIVGGLLLARAVTNLPVRRFFSLIRSRRTIRLQKTITIDAPVERVFEFWSNPENFARVMEHVQEVKRTGLEKRAWLFHPQWRDHSFPAHGRWWYAGPHAHVLQSAGWGDRPCSSDALWLGSEECVGRGRGTNEIPVRARQNKRPRRNRHARTPLDVTKRTWRYNHGKA